MLLSLEGEEKVEEEGMGRIKKKKKKKGRKDGGIGDCSVEEQSRASKWIPIHHGAGIFGASIFAVFGPIRELTQRH